MFILLPYIQILIASYANVISVYCISIYEMYMKYMKSIRNNFIYQHIQPLQIFMNV